jgi:hypothetical protein
MIMIESFSMVREFRLEEGAAEVESDCPLITVLLS